MQCVDNTEHMMEDKLSLRILQTNCELFEREAHAEFYSENLKEVATWGHNTKTDLKWIAFECVDWARVAQ